MYRSFCLELASQLQFAEFSKLMQFVSGDTHLSNRKLERMFREANSSYDFDDDSQALSHEELRHLAEVCMSNGIVVDTERDEMMEHLMAYVEEEMRNEAARVIEKHLRGYRVRAHGAVSKWRTAKRKLKAFKHLHAADSSSSQAQAAHL